jgi:hypothetical protein
MITNVGEDLNGHHQMPISDIWNYGKHGLGLSDITGFIHNTVSIFVQKPCKKIHNPSVII